MSSIDPQKHLQQLRAQLQLALEHYRVDRMVIELIRRTISSHVDDAGALLELEEELAKLELSEAQTYESMALPKLVQLNGSQVDVRLKIEEPGDAEEFERLLRNISTHGVCKYIVDEDGVKQEVEESATNLVMQGLGSIMWAVMACLNVWKTAGLLMRLGELDPFVLKIHREVDESGIPTGRLWFRNSVVLRCHVLLK